MRTPRTFALAAGFAAALLAVPASAGASGRCVAADLPWPVVLPDGSGHPAGTLRICHEGAFTPVSSIQEIEVAGRAAGRYLARVGRSETDGASNPIVVFARRGGDRMVLVGFAWPERDGRMRTFLFHGERNEEILLASLAKGGRRAAPSHAVLMASLY